MRTWRLELPNAYRQFDYNTITDIVMTLKYTARDGGGGFKTTVESAIRDLTQTMVLDARTTGLVQGYNVGKYALEARAENNLDRMSARWRG